MVCRSQNKAGFILFVQNTVYDSTINRFNDDGFISIGHIETGIDAVKQDVLQVGPIGTGQVWPDFAALAVKQMTGSARLFENATSARRVGGLHRLGIANLTVFLQQVFTLFSNRTIVLPKNLHPTFSQYVVQGTRNLRWHVGTVNFSLPDCLQQELCICLAGSQCFQYGATLLDVEFGISFNQNAGRF